MTEGGGAAAASGSGDASPGPALREPPRGIITFFYYEDLPGAVAYYRDVIGLRLALMSDWCVMFDLASGARLGLMNAVAGSQRPIPGPNKGAILSLEVGDLDACLQRLQGWGAADASIRLEPGCRGMTREFRVHDPGGYTVEFFCWVPASEADPPDAQAASGDRLRMG